MYPNIHSCVVRFKRVKCRKSTKEFFYMALPYKIFNFLVMWIELDVFIRKFIKRIKICANIRNFTKGIEISVNIRNFTKWIETSVNIRNFTSWIDTWREKSVWMFEILQSGFKSAVRGGSNIALTTTTKKFRWRMHSVLREQWPLRCCFTSTSFHPVYVRMSGCQPL